MYDTARVCIRSISARDSSWSSIAIVLHVSIGNTTAVNPRDRHPTGRTSGGAVWRTREIQI